VECCANDVARRFDNFLTFSLKTLAIIKTKNVSPPKRRGEKVKSNKNFNVPFFGIFLLNDETCEQFHTEPEKRLFINSFRLFDASGISLWRFECWGESEVLVSCLVY
jgi:hypothetical protein